MKQLTCEICGSTDLLKQDGVFVCQTCGTKYSVEEAKKMMIEGTVRIDNSHLVSNYLEMAEAAVDAGNNQEAESYCNKAIEIDPTNYKAWMIKGKAAAWQSSLQNSRVDEGVAAFIKAINNAPDDVKEELIENAKEQIISLSLAMISLRSDRFSKWPDEEEATGFVSDINSISGTVAGFLTQTGVLISREEIMAPIASIINKSVITAWQNVVWPEYYGDPNDSDDRAGKYELQTFIKRVRFCTDLLVIAISLCDDDDEGNITRYENLIFIHKAAIDSCSWKYTLDCGFKRWHVDWCLPTDAKNARREQIRVYETKIAQCKANVKEKKQREAEERNRAYWAEHAEEKRQLESELENLQTVLKELETQLAPFEKEIEALKDRREGKVPSEKEKDTVLAEISRIRQEQGKLGLFKGKEKKALQAQIDELNGRLSTINESIESERKEQQKECNAKIREVEERAKPIRAKIVATQKRINEIKAELTKNR